MEPFIDFYQLGHSRQSGDLIYYIRSLKCTTAAATAIGDIGKTV